MYIEFQPNQKFAIVGAEKSDSIDTFKDCGYLLQDDDVIIDIDCLPKNTIEKMIQIFDIKTQCVWTDRGVHLYYKKSPTFKNRANAICCLGFPIELKTSKNTKNGITVKRNGIARTITNEGVFEEIPLIFSKYKRFENLLGLQESEQRNNKLYIHRKQLENMNGWQKILRFINDFIFAEPLEEKEFTTICRDMNLNTDDIDENAVRAYVVNDYSIVKYGQDLWYYFKGEYIDDVDLLRRLIYARVPKVKSRFIDEVVRQIDYSVPKVDTRKAFDIKLGNGILREGKFYPIDSMEFTPYTIHIDYNEDCEQVPLVDDYIDKLTNNDPVYRDLLLEVLGFCFITDREFKRLLAKFFIFRGDGSNGKGTLIQIIKEILGTHNCSAISIQQMSDPTRLYSLKGKLANLGDDVEDKPITMEQSKLIKNITTCDLISMRQLYKTEESLQVTASLIFTSNHDIKTYEKGDAMKRRIKWLPMFTKIKDSDKRADFISQLTTPEALEYWLKLMVEGYERLYKNRQFTTSDVVEKFNLKYHEENNTVELFLKDVGIEALLGKTMKEIKDMIQEWNDEDVKIPSSKLIKNTLWNECQCGFRVSWVNKKASRTLVRQSETEIDVKP